MIADQHAESLKLGSVVFFQLFVSPTKRQNQQNDSNLNLWEGVD